MLYYLCDTIWVSKAQNVWFTEYKLLNKCEKQFKGLNVPLVISVPSFFFDTIACLFVQFGFANMLDSEIALN